MKVLEIAENQVLEQPEGHRIAVLFFASALEIMMEDVLVEILHLHTASEGLREIILDCNQGIARRRALFGSLSGTPLGKLLTEEWGQEFLRDWTTLAGHRNKLAHGSYFYRGSEDVMLLQRMRQNYLRVFVEMHNYVTRLAATPVNPFVEGDGEASNA